MLTQSEVKCMLDYNPDTGEIKWRKSKGSAKAGKKAGKINCKGYLVITINGVYYQGHRIAWLYHYGEWPSSHIDHIDHDKTNNAINNLRDVSMSGNMQNQIKAKSNNKSGLLGVSSSKHGFYAEIKVYGKRMYLGLHKTAQDAHDAYIKAKREMHTTNTL